MMTKNSDKKREQMIMLCMDDMVPQNHMLRLIDKAIDWTFIYELVEEKYCPDNGRPSMDPVMPIKIPFIQYLYGIKSMRQTIKEIEVNVAYRWFLGLDMLDPVPHFSTFGKNYTRRFKDTDLFEQIFAKILEDCMKFKLVDTDQIFVDSTHVKACANSKKMRKRVAHEQALWYEEKIPKVLFTDPRFNGVSTEAKIMYGVMLDRVSLSRKNGWIDENGNVYIQFTLSEMMEYFHWTKYRIYEILKELDTGGDGIGLVERKRTGCNKPNVLYVKNFASVLNRNRGALDFRNTDIRASEQSDIRTSENQHLYGAFHNVFLRDPELKELQRRFPYDWKEWIEKLSSYMKSTGKKYHNHYATICSWAAKEKNHTTVKNYDVPEGKGL